ncbi:sulfur relay (sulfurtransferase) complex TusBCD TusD component (DsrE family) [Clostridium saccharoperbutylacetonicum]|uniref:Uncharacterized protein n=1 Tax=Clostridium saccharoperbutylacetonicum N1-4(HMT) TaxID=931276 RepID=M1MKW6_9CLOT|nr:hypothetical protein [Clostridium saccharoperbutylacetonicum]AGF56913.1 hypothetical protein Cspa_c31520 [Clostridium saccharoperbutylacetonicum N1-4(HMT)]NRT62328.1 sulfur relay (sulfurtransferase) complex TusBCD TusD component (DsrE family) [Clostridium saccharoperbutylacetonicum]NSB25665.1 sulfur relay (sulfurtransferase) complex TusBCD TusD component (DsrE family) [Clostridium saccharoperbutylacetonicum]NSB45031.1 sulfur relay (sulfurtransferase) complex TusBCD TusD component (DsrE famil
MKNKLLGVTLSALLLFFSGAPTLVNAAETNQSTKIVNATHEHNWVELYVHNGCHTYMCTICHQRYTVCEY